MCHFLVFILTGMFCKWLLDLAKGGGFLPFENSFQDSKTSVKTMNMKMILLAYEITQRKTKIPNTLIGKLLTKK